MIKFSERLREKQQFSAKSILCLQGFLFATLILSLTGCSWLFGGSGYEVKTISDGDTLTVTDATGKDIKVRFACIDAPEIAHSKAERQSRKARDKNQFQWGETTKNRLQELIQQNGNRVQLTVTDTDRYGRQVSEVRLNNGILVQEILTQEGLALVYRPYLKDCPSADLVQQAETQAKQQKTGVWKDSKFIPPWEYRRTDQ